MFLKLYVILILPLYFNTITAQSQCSTLCELTPDCKNGKCSISKCWEKDGCLQFCLDCSGQQFCTQSGQSCVKNSTSIPFIVQYNSSKFIGFKIEVIFSIILFVLYINFK